ncbi:MAG: phytanoyl-CoA dioxygenase [Planctomycetaceae bacterium]|nr:phytanoyl-CoA dioxygenase [Planctomycetaceae bacterium]
MSIERDGILVVENCCSPDECKEISTRLDTIAKPGSRLLLNNDWCQDLAKTLRMRIAKTCPFLAELVAVQCTYFNKTAETNWSINFHQDRSVPVAVGSARDDSVSVKEGITFLQAPDRLLAEMLALRLHLDDANKDNGPLRVLPGSHRHGVLDEADIPKLRDRIPEQPVTAMAGSVLLMRPLILHASSKATAASPRRVLHFVFGPSPRAFGIEWHMAI